jgi:hypothetical protein
VTPQTRFGKPRRTPRVSVERALAFEKRLAEGKVYRVQLVERRPPKTRAPVESHGDPYRTTDPYR